MFDECGTTIYRDRNEVKVMNWNGLLVNVKKYAIPNIVNRFVYTSFRKPKAVRAYEYAFLLQEKGINTPEPIGYVLEKGLFDLKHSFLITIHIPSQRRMYEFGEGGVEGREEIIKGLGKFAADIHEAGVLHLDFSPGNILFELDHRGVPTFTLVDINRMVFREVSMKRGCASFARLWGDEDFRNMLAESYAHARGEKDIESAKKWIHQYHQIFWRSRAPWVVKKEMLNQI